MAHFCYSGIVEDKKPTRFTNNKNSTARLVQELRKNGLNIIIFGGWSVELQKLKEPWKHSDIDLLLVDNTFNSLNRLVNERCWKICKSYNHKKAFLIDGVMVEVFLVMPEEKRFITRFVGSGGSYDFVWPKELFVNKTLGGASYQLASKASMDKYFNEHTTIHSLSPWA